MATKFKFAHYKKDIPAGIVVFFVALPLCLGIAMASGASPFAGLISGIVGGVVVGTLSGSSLGVSGPAAGLAVIVLNSIEGLGGFDVFLAAVVLSGIFQLILGFIKAGIIAYYFPSSVINGMLSGIGVLIFFKQIPHAFGYDKVSEMDVNFVQQDGENTFSELVNMLDYITPGVTIITFSALFILILWQQSFIQKNKILSLIPGPVLAVLIGVVLQFIFHSKAVLKVEADHLVQLPIFDGFDNLKTQIKMPDFWAFSNIQVYSTAFVLAIVASLETLLCVEASDKQDTLKRITPTNRELKAQGIGNIVSGLIGGLPITQVIVRSSANQQSGGVTKLSTIVHGSLLLFSVLFIPDWLNHIPKAALAAILFVIGYKLAEPSLFKKMYKQGWECFIPFMVTLLMIVFTNLLMGIVAGLIIAVFMILYNNYKIPFKVIKYNNIFKIVFPTDVTFVNKASVLHFFKDVPDDSIVELDVTQTHYIHFDIQEIIEDFKINAPSRNIKFIVINDHIISSIEHKTFEFES